MSMSVSPFKPMSIQSKPRTAAFGCGTKAECLEFIEKAAKEADPVGLGGVKESFISYFNHNAPPNSPLHDRLMDKAKLTRPDHLACQVASYERNAADSWVINGG